MLVLTRKPKESIIIGEDITVTVLSVNGDQVKIGFNAPRNIEINREEIYERKQKAKLTGIADDIADSNNG